ncbi:MAG TPA: hypothetical protein VFI13_03990, partial [Gemmatimonadales bacterium]|nr:hypothetical protein [Gemmatimonadales bacterium]
MRTFLAAGLLLLGAGARTAAAQDLAARIVATHADRVSFTFAAKPGVCGCGDNINFRGTRDDDDDGECTDGPVRVTLERAGGVLTRVRVKVGGKAPVGAEDLGDVAPAVRAPASARARPAVRSALTGRASFRGTRPRAGRRS